MQFARILSRQISGIIVASTVHNNSSLPQLLVTTGICKIYIYVHPEIYTSNWRETKWRVAGLKCHEFHVMSSSSSFIFVILPATASKLLLFLLFRFVLIVFGLQNALCNRTCIQRRFSVRTSLSAHMARSVRSLWESLAANYNTAQVQRNSGAARNRAQRYRLPYKIKLHSDIAAG